MITQTIDKQCPHCQKEVRITIIEKPDFGQARRTVTLTPNYDVEYRSSSPSWFQQLSEERSHKVEEFYE